MDAGGDDHQLPSDAANHGVHVDAPTDVDGCWVDEVLGAGDEELSKSLPDSQTHEDELIISFQGDVHVFNGVSQRKVEAILYLLGDHEPSADVTGRPVLDLNAKDSEEVSQSESSTKAYRQQAIMRYREKKKRRNLVNTVKYECRQEAASRYAGLQTGPPKARIMKRYKGQFASSRANIVAEGNPSNEKNSQEETYPMFCQNCRISKDETPMMRRGPNGPRSLCNPCGLKWAHTGTLRVPPRVPSSIKIEQGIAQIPPEVPSSVDKDLQINKIDQGIAQIPPEVPSSVDKDIQINNIDQIDDNDIKVSDFSWDGLLTESAETGQAGNEN